jgi:anti-sigma B factor antagonist
MGFATSNEPRDVRAGLLTLRLEKSEETCVIGLCGELDLANAEALESELGRALSDGDCQVVVDMSELTFIDSTGLALLVAALGRDQQDGGRLSFVPSPSQAVTRVLQMTGIGERLPLATG